MDKWNIESTEEVLASGIFSLRKKHCLHPVKNVTFDFYTINTSDWINIVALTADGRFVMVRQHRLGTDLVTIETPGGLVEPGEAPEHTAARELREETGYQVGDLRLLLKLSVNPAIMSNYVYIYCATGCSKVAAQDLDGGEDIDVVIMERKDVLDGIQGGAIDHSIAVAALMLYFSAAGSGGISG